MARLPFNISNQSLTFYIKGRPHSLTKEHANYAKARELLQAPGDHDADELVALVDVRKGLLKLSQGQIVFDGDDVLFKGQALHNLWVDKILEFRDAGEDFSPIWNALDKLVHNPTPAAVERLPIFLERSGLGFLPDGRFIAFKGVQMDLRSFHRNLDGTYFTHEIGAKPRMDRKDVDPNPNQTCSYGLHVGTPDYVKQYYSNGAVVLVAVDPVDVVAVPTDYQGAKMRVCGYEVIDHLDRDYSDELMGRLRTTVTGYTPDEPEIGDQGADVGESGDWVDPAEDEEDEEEDAIDLDVGDLVRVSEGGWPPAGIYPIVGVTWNGYELRTEHDGDVFVTDEQVTAFEYRPWMRAEIGGTVDLRPIGKVGEAYRNGAKGIEVVDLALNGETPQVQVRTPAGPWWVAADRVTASYGA